MLEETNTLRPASSPELADQPPGTPNTERGADWRCAIHLIIGSAICLIAVLAMMDVVAGRNVLSIDVTVGRWLQRDPIPYGEPIAAFGNAAGSTSVGVPIALFAAASLALARRWTDVIFLLGLLLARGLNAPLKELASSPRPSGSLLHVSEIARGFGFPSGHSMGAVLLAGSLAYVAWSVLPGRRIRGIPLVVAVTVVLATGYGRVDTGAHWPTDVLGGFLSGGFVLFVGILIHRLMVSYRTRRASDLTTGELSA